jgi:hypothetical protein
MKAMKIQQQIDNFSLRALLITSDAADGKALASATGFSVLHKGIPFLVTNLHVVTGEHPQTGKNLSNSFPPEHVSIFHHVTERLRIGHGVWSLRKERLLDDSLSPLWFEHPNKDIKNPDAIDELVVVERRYRCCTIERAKSYRTVPCQDFQ